MPSEIEAQVPTGELRLVKRRKRRSQIPQVEPVPLDPAAYVDTRVVDENGKLTELTLPIQPMNRDQYERELSEHGGFNHFLRDRSFADIRLALSRDGSPKATKFLKALVHPKNRGTDIATIAERCGITYNDLMAVWRNDKLAEAVLTVYDRAPLIAEHTAKDAESMVDCCPRCDGAGVMKINREEIFSWVECVVCKGAGSIRKIGNKASRQFVFETVGMVKGSSSSVQINNNINVSSVDSVIDEMERATGVVDVSHQKLD